MYSIEFIREQFKKEGYILLTSGCLNSTVKLECLCPKGHKYLISWNHWQQGRRCAICAGRHKTIDQIRNSFLEDKYILLTDEYINSEQKLEYICPKGHKHLMNWGNWKGGKRCPTCANKKRSEKRRIKFEFVKAGFEKEGYKLLSLNVKSAKEKLEYICPVGHRGSICWNNFQQGKRCKKCANIRTGHLQRYLTIEFIKKEFKKEGYILLTSFYKNAFQKLEYICPRNHRHSISWANWQQGKRCAYCSNHVLKTIDEIRLAFELEGFTLLTAEYKDAHQKLEYICPKGHKYYIQWANWQQGYRCTKCSRENARRLMKQHWNNPEFQKKVYKSLNLKPNKPEQALSDLLQNLFPNEYKYVGDFQFFLGGKNPDFMNCNHQKKLIELYGDYWHKDDDPQDRIDHFKQYGFNTLIVWEHELKDQKTLRGKLKEFHKVIEEVIHI